MYIAKIRLENYRCFRDTSIDFQPHINLIIGENNAGKSTLLKALGLVFDRQARHRMDVYDFHQGVTDLKSPPHIRITVTLKSEGSGNDTLEDKALVATWLTKLEQDWEAQLTYEFALPEEETSAFDKALGSTPTRDRFWDTVSFFLDKYTTRIYGGSLAARVRAEPDSLAKFDYRLLDAIRDVVSDLFSGSNTLLKSMLQQVMDADLTGESAEEERRKRWSSFRDDAAQLAKGLMGRIDEGKLTYLVTDTGAADGGSPKLAGHPDEADILSAMRLFVERAGFDLPADKNGLGYNNLIYVSLILASLDYKTDTQRMGPNAALFPMLLIEEPEAHLHPALQYKLLKCIRGRLRTRKSRQVFVTTHSTHVTAASDLDEIICLCAPEGDADPKVAYPGKVFKDSPDGMSSKKYVERYLDATKSNLLFSKGVIFVEGLAEQLLLPRFAECIGLRLEDHHVAVIAVGGATFKHFLPLFGAGCPPEKREYALNRPVACVLDADPMRKAKNEKGARWMKCWPYQINLEPASFDYKERSGAIDNLKEQIGTVNSHILLRYGKKTFEYDLALANHGSAVLSKGIQPTELEDEIRTALDTLDGKRDQTEFATCYLIGIEDAKGEHAFDLERMLRDGLAGGDGKQVAFAVPDYIADSIRWACRAPDGGASV